MSSVRVVIDFFRAYRVPVLIVAAAVFMLTSAWFFFDRQTRENIGGPEPVGEELRKMVERAASHAMFPEGEEPTVATVVDPAKLAGQEFFRRARVGDAVLVFRNAKMVILYNPESDRIVNMAPLTDESEPGAPGTSGIAAHGTPVIQTPTIIGR